jgi:hypothetical protein
MKTKYAIISVFATIAIASIGATIATVGTSGAQDATSCSNTVYAAYYKTFCASVAGHKASEMNRRRHRREHYAEYNVSPTITVMRDHQSCNEVVRSCVDQFIVTQTAEDVAADRAIGMQRGWLPSVADFYAKHPQATAVAVHHNRPATHTVNLTVDGRKMQFVSNR